MRSCLGLLNSTLHFDSTLSKFELFFGGHPIFFRIDRTENVDLWLSSSTHFNYFASSNFMAIVALPSLISPGLLVCSNTFVFLHVHPLLDL